MLDDDDVLAVASDRKDIITGRTHFADALLIVLMFKCFLAFD